MKKQMTKVLTLLLALTLIVSFGAVSLSAFAEDATTPEEGKISWFGIKYYGQGDEYCLEWNVSPANLPKEKQVYWEGNVHTDVITTDNFNAFASKVVYNGKTFLELIDANLMKWIVNENNRSDDMFASLSFAGLQNSTTVDSQLNGKVEVDVLTFQKGCRLPNGTVLMQDYTWRIKGSSVEAVTTAATTATTEAVETSETSETSATTATTETSATTATTETSATTATTATTETSATTATTAAPTKPIITPPTTDAPEAKITWTGVHMYDTTNNYYIMHLNVSPKTLTAGEKYFENGDVQNISDAQFYQLADYIFFNGYSLKDLIEKDPDIVVAVQASNGRTDNLEFTLSPAALAKNNIPYYGTTLKGETVDLRAGCLLPNGTELKANDAWVMSPGQPQGIKVDPSYIEKAPVKYYPNGSETTATTKGDATDVTTTTTAKKATYTVEGMLVDEKGKVLGGVSMSINGNGTQTIITEDDGSFLLQDMQAGKYTFLVIKNGVVSSLALEVKVAANANDVSVSSDGTELTIPAKAKTLTMTVELNASDLKITDAAVSEWTDGYTPEQGGNTDSTSGDVLPETGDASSSSMIIIALLAIAMIGVLCVAKKKVQANED